MASSKMPAGVTRDLSKYTYVDRPVSIYVMEMLGIEVGPQNRLIAARRVGPWVCQDKVMVVARVWKQHHANFISVFRFCYVEADNTVYCLAHLDNDRHMYRAFSFTVGDDNVTFYKVDSIVTRKNFIRAFLDMEIRIKENRSASTLDNEVASKFIFENLDLVPGDQSNILAVKYLNSEDNLKLVARVVRQNRGASFLPRYKFALDSVTSTIFVLVLDAEDAELMTGHSFEVEGKDMCFYRVLKMEERSKADDLYQFAYCNRIWPLASERRYI